MHRRIILAGLLLALAVPVWAQPGEGRQIVSFNLGGFVPRGADSRVVGDTLYEDLSILWFRMEDFRNVTAGGDWLIGVGDFLEVGVGINYYQKKVPSVYADWVDEDGSEIAQDLKLRIAPLSATLRFLPLSNRAPVQPYIGAGLAVMFWRYSETGEFVDSYDNSIYTQRYVGSGTNVGPVILGGVRAPLGDRLLIGGEIRWQRGEGELSLDDFLGDRIDLGGMTYQFTLGVRF